MRWRASLELLTICSPIVLALPVNLRFGEPLVRQAGWLHLVMRILESSRSEFGQLQELIELLDVFVWKIDVEALRLEGGIARDCIVRHIEFKHGNDDSTTVSLSSSSSSDSLRN